MDPNSLNQQPFSNATPGQPAPGGVSAMSTPGTAASNATSPAYWATGQGGGDQPGAQSASSAPTGVDTPPADTASTPADTSVSAGAADNPASLIRGMAQPVSSYADAAQPQVATATPGSIVAPTAAVEAAGPTPFSSALHPDVITQGPQWGDNGSGDNQPPSSSPTGSPWYRKGKLLGALAAVVLMLGVGAFALFSRQAAPTSTSGNVKNGNYTVTNIALTDLAADNALSIDGDKQLSVNGQLRVNNGLVISSSDAPSNPVEGQMYFDKNTNQLMYYNGSKFAPLATSIGGQAGTINVGGGISLVNSTLINSGAISVQGQTGAVTFTGGGGINLNGTTITNTGVLGISSNPNQLSVISNNGNVQISLVGIQDGGVLVGRNGGLSSVLPASDGLCLISTANGPQFGSCTGQATVNTLNGASGTVTINAGGGIAVNTDTSTGTITIASTAGTGLTSLNGQTGPSLTIANATGLGNTITIDTADATKLGLVKGGGTGVTINGSGVVSIGQDVASSANVTFNSLSLTSALSVANGGTGSTSFNQNGLLLGNGTNPVTTLSASGAGLCLMSATSGSDVVPIFQACPVGGNVIAGTGIQQTTGRLTMWDATANKIIDSKLGQSSDGLTLTAYANLVLNSGVNISGDGSGLTSVDASKLEGHPASDFMPAFSVLPVSQGGTGQSSLAANALLVGNGAGAINTIGASTDGLCLMSTSSGPVFQACPVGGNVIAGTGIQQTTGRLTMWDATANKIIDSKLGQSSDGLTLTAYANLVLNSGVNISGDGSGLTALNANELTSGTVSDARLSANVALLNAANTFTNNTTIQKDSTTALVVQQGSSGNQTLTVDTTNNVVGIGTAPSLTDVALQVSGAGQFFVDGTNHPIVDNAHNGSIFFDTVDGKFKIIEGGSEKTLCNTVNQSCGAGTADIKLQSAYAGGNTITTSDARDIQFSLANTATDSSFLVDIQSGSTGKFAVQKAGTDVLTVTANPSSAVSVNGNLTVSNGTIIGDGSTITNLNAGNIATGKLAIARGGTNSDGTGYVTGALMYYDGTSIKTLSSAGTTNQCLVSGGTGNAPTFTSCDSAGAVTATSSNAGKLAKFSNSTTITDSIIGDDGSTATVSGKLAVTGANSLTLGTQNTGTGGSTGSITFNNDTNAHTITLQSTSTAADITFTLPSTTGANGQCLTTNGSGALTFADCLSGAGGGASGVASLNGLSGSLSIAGNSNEITVTPSGSTIQLSLPQAIGTTSAVHFASALLDGSGVGRGITLGSSTNAGLATFLSGSGSSTKLFLQPSSLSGTDKTVNLADRSGTVLVDADSTDFDVTTNAGKITLNTVGITKGGTGATSASSARTNLGAAASGANSDITSLSGLTTALSVLQGGTGGATASAARTNLGAAASGANSDITSLSGLTTALSIGQGGTGATSASGARTNLGAAASGANSDITSLSGLTTALSVTQGGTGAATASAALLNLGGAARGANSDITSLSGLTTALSIGQGGTGATTASAALLSLGGAARGANSDITSLSGLTTALSVLQGGTGSTTASGARTNLGAAANGANSDITSLSGLTTALTIGQGGTGATTASAALLNLGGAARGANSDITSLSGLTTALSIGQGGTGATTASAALLNLGGAARGANGDITSLTGLTTALSTSQGGTGLSITNPSDGQLLIGNGTGFTNATLTAGSGVTIVNGSGSITISAPSAGSCSTCATKALDNLASVALNVDLNPGTAGAINLGSASTPFKDLYLGTSSTKSVHFDTSGLSTGRQLTIPNVDGTICVSSATCTGYATLGSLGNNTIVRTDAAHASLVNSQITDDGNTVALATSLFTASSTNQAVTVANSGTAAQTATALAVTSAATTGKGLSIAADALTTGSALSVSSNTNTATSGNLAVLSQTGTYTAAGSTSASLLNVNRANTVNITNATPVTRVNATSTAQNATSFSFTTSSNPNRYLIVTSLQLGVTPATVKFGATNLTFVGCSPAFNFFNNCIYTLVAPAANTTANITTNSGYPYMTATEFYNVDQVTPIGTTVSASGTGASLPITVTGISTDVFFESAGMNNTGGATVTPGSGETLVSSFNASSSAMAWGVVTKPGTGSTTMSPTFSATSYIGVIGFAIHQASAPAEQFTGNVVSFSSNCTVTSGACADSSNILNLNQQYSGATGAVLAIQNAGNGPDIQLGSGVIRPASDSTSAIKIQNATGTSTVFMVDTINKRVAIGSSTAPSYTLDVTGDANITGVYRVNGTQISTSNLSDGGSLVKLGSSASGSATTTLNQTNTTSTGIQVQGSQTTASVFAVAANAITTGGSALNVTSTSNTLAGANLAVFSETPSTYTSAGTISGNVVNASRTVGVNTGSITKDGSSGSVSGSGASLTLSNYTTAGTSNRVLIVSVESNVASTFFFGGSATYNGVAMTALSSNSFYDGTANSYGVQFFYLINPPAGTFNVVYTPVQTMGSAYMSASSWSNVDQTSPISKFVTPTGTSNTVTSAINAASNEVAIDAAYFQTGTATKDATQTYIHNTGANAGSSYKSGGTTNMVWTSGSSTNWAAEALALAPAGVKTTGAVGSLSSTCTITTGACQDSAAILSLSQLYAGATGGVLNIQNAGTGPDIQSTDTSSTSTNSNGLTIRTGNATGATSNSGNLTLDVGTATGTAGTVKIGTGNASGVTIGRTGSTVTLAGTTNKVAVNSATAFQVQNSGGTTNLVSADTNNNVLTAGAAYTSGLTSADINSFTASTAMTISATNYYRQSHGSVSYNGYLYTVGGYDGVNTTTKDTVQYAKINADGTISSGAWTLANPINVGGSQPRQQMGTVVANGYLYVLGGTSTNATSGGQSTVYYAKLNSDGSLGSWNATSSLNTARSGVSAVYANGYIYVIGGSNTSNTALSTIEYGKVNADGTVSSWSQVNLGSSAVARYQSAAVVANGNLYVIGGSTTTLGSGATATTKRAKLNADGSLNWQSDTSNLAAARMWGSAMVLNGYIYYFGGLNSSSVPQNTIYYAPINSDGTIGTGTYTDYSATRTTPFQVYGQTTTTLNGNIYFVGGYNNGNAATTNAVYIASTARLKVAGSLDLVGSSGGGQGDTGGGGTLTAGNTNIVGTLSVGGEGNFVQGVAIGGNLSVAGQGAFKNTTNSTTAFTVQNSSGTTLLNVDTVNSNVSVNTVNGGGVGPWTSQATTLTRESHASIAANGYIYTVGGWDGASTLTNVSYAKIGANGSVGGWTSTQSLNTARFDHDVTTYNGYIYTLGGDDGSGNKLTSVEYAKLNADGTTSSWATTTPLPQGRERIGSMVVNGYIYVIGGIDPGNNPSNVVYYAPLNADGTVGTWNTTTNIGASNATADYSYAAANGYIYIIGGTNNNPVNKILYGKVNSDGTISSWTTSASTLTIRAAGTAVINGYIYVVGGATTSSSSSAQSTVMYAKIGANGDIGAWSTNSYALGCATAGCGSPTPRLWPTVVTANGYLYSFGGNNGSSTVNTMMYSSIARLSVGAALDLVGSSGTNLSDGSGGGSGGQLTSGDTRIVGTLDVQGQANFNQGVGIAGNLSVGGGAAVNGTLKVTGAVTLSSTLTVAGAATFNGNIIVNGHIITGGNTPTKTVQYNLGSTGTCNFATGSNDSSGTIMFTPNGSHVGGGDMCQITFTSPYGSAPRVIVSPVDYQTAALDPYAVSDAATDFRFGLGIAPTAGTTYTLNYVVLQ